MGQALSRLARKPGYVYYARIGDLVKIGFTADYFVRMQNLQPDEVLAIEPGQRGTECARHRQFADVLADGREYFLPTPEVIAWVDQMRAEHGEPGRWRTWRPARVPGGWAPREDDRP